MNKRYIFNITMIFVLYVFINTSLFAQSKNVYNLFSSSDNSSLKNSPELAKYINDAVLLNINKEELQNLCDNRNLEITMDIPYGQGNARLNLKRFDILAPNAKIIARTQRGNEEVALNDMVVSYTGKMEGLENTLVTMNFTRDNVVGFMTTPEDNYVLGALNSNGRKTDSYILYKEGSLKVKNTFHCAVSDEISPEQINEIRDIIMNKLNDSSPTDLYVAEIAIDLDYATYAIYDSSVQAATNYALTLMSAVSAIYMKEVNVKLIVPYLRVWTTPDPYTSNNGSTLLNQFKDEWNTNQQSVQRTLAHLITRKAGVSVLGIAWLNVLCSSPSFGNGYGLTAVNGIILPLPTYSRDVHIVAHELGHNFGSPHTFNCGWPGGPIDSCYATEGGCYSGPPIPRVGTIMSYCYLNGSVSLVEGFGPLPKALIRDRSENAFCIQISNRDLVVAYPNGGEILRTGSGTQLYWGSSLTGNINIELSLNNGSTWQTIQNNVPATQRILDWVIPNISTTSQAKIRMINSANPNIGDTSDASFRIVLTLNAFYALSPPSFTRIEVSASNPDIQQFIWSSAGTDPTIKYKFKIRKIGTIADYSYISNNSGSDTTVGLRKSFLDSLSQTLGTTGDSVRCSWRAWAYNGYDSSGSGTTFIVSFARTTVGINILSSVIPDKYSLGNNYPNPFNPSTNIKFDIPDLTFVELSVYDSRGREVNTLVNEKLQPGSYEYSWTANNLPSGTYFYRLKTSDYVETRKMILIK